MADIEIYLPENPASLINMALNAIGGFADDGSDFETDYVAISSDGSVPSKMSLAAAVIYNEYDSLEMFEKTADMRGSFYLRGLTGDNEFYNSHVNFINSFVEWNISNLMAFVNPRCVMRIEQLPPWLDIDNTNTAEGMQMIHLTHENLTESIENYVQWRVLDGESYDDKITVDVVINRLIKMERLLKEFFIYVPTS